MRFIWEPYTYGRHAATFITVAIMGFTTTVILAFAVMGVRSGRGR